MGRRIIRKNEIITKRFDWFKNIEWLYDRKHKGYVCVLFTPKGLIKVFHSDNSAKNRPRNAAFIVYRGKVYWLYAQNKITRTGWLRIVKKWAKRRLSGEKIEHKMGMDGRPSKIVILK